MDAEIGVQKLAISMGKLAVIAESRAARNFES
jgi:hypothetical protein